MKYYQYKESICIYFWTSRLCRKVLVVSVLLFIRNKTYNYECSPTGTPSSYCEEMGAFVGVFMFSLWKHEWLPQIPVSWNKGYDQTGIFTQCSSSRMLNPPQNILQMAFSYIIMQCLPSTLEEFQHSSPALNTFASILYGKKKYVAHLWCAINMKLYYLQI